MGIGRFAFTPILPMMLHDGVVDLPRASWLASTNYLGYLVGALLCTFDPWLRRKVGIDSPADGPALVRRGLAATALLTLAMALPWPATWPALRFAAGVVSAYVFVYSSGWCLAQLATRGAPALGGVMGGVRKLLDIAMSLSAEPRLLLLDEPTSGVAAEEKFPMMDTIMRGLEDAAMTVLFVEHDMDIVERYASRVIAFYAGRIIADAAPGPALASADVRRYVTGELLAE